MSREGVHGSPLVRTRHSRQRPVATDERPRTELNWLRMDLHIHTPGSSDYQDKDASYIQILQHAEMANLDIMAFTDHNSVRGYARMWREIEDLELLEALKRIQPDEAQLLAEYRRLLNKILVLPGFEFTATFGFHILAIFPEDSSIRKLEHVLLLLGVPEDKLDRGSSEVGATTDVLQTYELLHEAGAIVIAAHVNSTHGVAMQKFPFGGQTKIAYTQSPLLHALEATDLTSGNRRNTERFFNGSKPEYPRRMHCIQGSDAHRLMRDPERETNLGIGDRPTEIQIESPSFQLLKALFESNDFDRTRPYRPEQSAFDLIVEARSEGNTEVQQYYERPASRRSRTNATLKDVVALANTHGGSIYIGLGPDPSTEIIGVPKAQTVVENLSLDISRYVTPSPEATVEVCPTTDGKELVVIKVGEGTDKPYALGNGEILVRHEGETAAATRDEIIELVRTGVAGPKPEAAKQAIPSKVTSTVSVNGTAPTESGAVALPRTGVEIVSSENRDGVNHHSMRDLRNKKVVPNVTRASSKRLWRYAITERETHPAVPGQIQWSGPRGFVKCSKQRDGVVRYDLAFREDGHTRIFYGVTDEGLDDEWRAIIPVNAVEATS